MFKFMTFMTFLLAVGLFTFGGWLVAEGNKMEWGWFFFVGVITMITSSIMASNTKN